MSNCSRKNWSRTHSSSEEKIFFVGYLYDIGFDKPSFGYWIVLYFGVHLHTVHCRINIFSWLFWQGKNSSSSIIWKKILNDKQWVLWTLFPMKSFSIFWTILNVPVTWRLQGQYVKSGGIVWISLWKLNVSFFNNFWYILCFAYSNQA